MEAALPRMLHFLKKARGRIVCGWKIDFGEKMKKPSYLFYVAVVVDEIVARDSSLSKFAILNDRNI